MKTDSIQSPDASIGPGLAILGMHRSGTSALAGVFHLLGANLGNQFIDTEPEINLKGYWENREANHFDDRLLKFLESDWYDVLDLPHQWLEKSSEAGFDGELAQLLKANFTGETPWVVKDPRLCRLLPFWLDVLEKQNVGVKCLIVLRHPFEVAQSLRKRDGIEMPHALLLWLRYVLDSELSSRSTPRNVITYENLLNDWRAVLEKAESTLDLGLGFMNDDVNQRIDAFLDRGLRHHVHSSDHVENPLLTLAISAYESLQLDDQKSLSQIRSEFRIEMKKAQPWLTQFNHVQRNFHDYRSRSEQDAKQLKKILNSRTWRWASPLRLLANKLKHR